jgi:pseudouridine kinase
MSLTDLESRLLAQLKAQPFATQKELGEALGISRASVANYVERLQNKGLILGRAYIFAQHPGVTCIGGAVLDRILRLSADAIARTSQPGTSRETRGGVARNVAENLAQLGDRVKLISVVGADEAGRTIIEATEGAGVDVSLVDRKPQGITGTYTAVMQPTGELHLGIADMAILDELDAQTVDRHWQHIVSSQIVFAETNCAASLLAVLLKRCKNNHIPLAIDAVSIPKFKRLPDDLSGITYLFCNYDEARSSCAVDDPLALAKALQERGAENVVITNGSDPILCASPTEYALIHPKPTQIVDVSGAGDAFVAGALHALIEEQGLFDAARYGAVAASLTLQSELRNSPDLTGSALADAAQEIKIEGPHSK